MSSPVEWQALQFENNTSPAAESPSVDTTTSVLMDGLSGRSTAGAAVG